jgi:hypothetical protein
MAIPEERRHDMRTSANTAKIISRSSLKSTLFNLRNSFSLGEFTRENIEKLAAQAIISTDKLLHGRKYAKYRFINADDLCVLMNDMGMIADAGKVKKGGPEPTGGACAQAIDYGIWQVDNIPYPVAAEQTFRLHRGI